MPKPAYPNRQPPPQSKPSRARGAAPLLKKENSVPRHHQAKVLLDRRDPPNPEVLDEHLQDTGRDEAREAGTEGDIPDTKREEA